MTAYILMVLLGAQPSSQLACAYHTQPIKDVCYYVYNDTLKRIIGALDEPNAAAKKFAATTSKIGFNSGVRDALPFLEPQHLCAKYCLEAVKVITSDKCAANTEEKAYLERKTAGLCDSLLSEEDIRPGTGDVDAGAGAKKILDLFGGGSREKAEAGIITFLPAYLAGVAFEHTYNHAATAKWIMEILEKRLGEDLHRCGSYVVVREVYLQFVSREKICTSQRRLLPSSEILTRLKSPLANICKEPPEAKQEEVQDDQR